MTQSVKIDSFHIIGKVISKVFDAPVDGIVSANYETGYLDAIALSDNKLFRVREDSDGYLSCQYLPGEGKKLNEFAKYLLNDVGIRYDSNDSFLYASGLFNQDSLGTIKCKPGNVPCGNRCLPKGYKCRKNQPVLPGRKSKNGTQKLSAKDQRDLKIAKGAYGVYTAGIAAAALHQMSKLKKKGAQQQKMLPGQKVLAPSKDDDVIDVEVKPDKILPPANIKEAKETLRKKASQAKPKYDPGTATAAQHLEEANRLMDEIDKDLGINSRPKNKKTS